MANDLVTGFQEELRDRLSDMLADILDVYYKKLTTSSSKKVHPLPDDSGLVQSTRADEAVGIDFKDNSVLAYLHLKSTVWNVETGRRKGMVPWDGRNDANNPILMWVRKRRIESDPKRQKSAAWAIRKHIMEHGIPRTDYLEDSINEVMRNKDYISEIESLGEEYVAEYIFKRLEAEDYFVL